MDLVEEKKMGEEVTYSPEQWVEHYQGDYLKTMTIETAGRIIKSDMTNVARSCVSVGFHLKAIRDMELFRDAGYDTLWDYAADQFGISKSSASRYMEINDRFSIGGNTPMLQREYKDFSKSQLQEMISLSPEQARKVTAKTTVKQIREMKTPKKKVEEQAVVEQKDIPGQMNVKVYPGVVPEKSVATSQQKSDSSESRSAVEDGEQDREIQNSVIVEYDRSTLKRMIKDTESVSDCRITRAAGTASAEEQ